MYPSAIQSSPDEPRPRTIRFVVPDDLLLRLVHKLLHPVRRHSHESPKLEQGNFPVPIDNFFQILLQTTHLAVEVLFVEGGEFIGRVAVVDAFDPVLDFQFVRVAYVWFVKEGLFVKFPVRLGVSLSAGAEVGVKSVKAFYLDRLYGLVE